MKKLLNKCIQGVFGVFDVVIKTRDAFSTNSLKRFLNHITDLGLSPTTIIEVGEKISSPALYQKFINSNYIFVDINKSEVVLNLYSNSTCVGDNLDDLSVTDRKNDQDKALFRIDSTCMERNFKGSYLLYLHGMKDTLLILKGCKNIFKDIELILFEISIININYYIDSHFFQVHAFLEKEGFIIYDMLGTHSWKNNESCNEATIIYARKENILLKKQLYLKNKNKPSKGLNKGVTKFISKIKDCLILGTGRSGTSMLSGILYEAGYYMGENLYRGRPTNPKGFFECGTINYINEDILNAYRDLLTDYVKDSTFKDLYNLFGLNKFRNPINEKGQGWLCSIPSNVNINYTNRSIDLRIKEMVSRKPFCYKDPRFSYTLPVWKRFLRPDTVLICVFREPNITIESILTECRDMPYLKELKINTRIGYKVYENMYSHVLNKNSDIFDNIIFVHYEQIFNGTSLPKISELLGVGLDNNFVARELKRTKSYKTVPENVKNIYSKLCELANYKER